MHLDLDFPIVSPTTIAADHGYHLYSGLSRILPVIHADSDIAVHPIRGQQAGNRRLQLMPWSTLRLRLPQDMIGDVISLAGQSISIGQNKISLGVPSVKALEPSTALRSRLVIIKGFMEPEPFAEAVRRQLDKLGISAEVSVTIRQRMKPEESSPRFIRRTLRIKDKEVVGFEVILEGLLADESIAVQETGIGGRRRMGCGVFVPLTVKS